MSVSSTLDYVCILAVSRWGTVVRGAVKPHPLWQALIGWAALLQRQEDGARLVDYTYCVQILKLLSSLATINCSAKLTRGI